MYVEWDPEDGSDKQTWTFDPKDVLRKEATDIERQYGEAWDNWINGLRLGEIKARSILLWHMLRQVHPKLRFEDVPDFRVRQLTVHMGVNELTDLLKRMARMKLTDETREAATAAIEADIKEAMEREGIDGQARWVEGRLEIEGIKDELPKSQ